MRASKLIENLQALVQEHGDLDVVVSPTMGEHISYESILCVSKMMFEDLITIETKTLIK